MVKYNENDEKFEIAKTNDNGFFKWIFNGCIMPVFIIVFLIIGMIRGCAESRKRHETYVEKYPIEERTCRAIVSNFLINFKGYRDIVESSDQPTIKVYSPIKQSVNVIIIANSEGKSVFKYYDHCSETRDWWKPTKSKNDIYLVRHSWKCKDVDSSDIDYDRTYTIADWMFVVCLKTNKVIDYHSNHDKMWNKYYKEETK